MRLIAYFLALFLSYPAFAADNKPDYPSADIGEYYRSLMQPDNPKISCCGDGDAYYADIVEPCAMTDGPRCALVVIITDTRSDTITRADGSTIVREHVPPGTRIVIPRNKLRRYAIPNPTDRNIVFLGYGVNVYCFEPVSGI